MELKPPLSNAQLKLLKLFSRDVPESDLLELKAILVRFLAEKATSAMDAFLTQEGITPEEVDGWASEHNRRKDVGN